MAHSEGTEGLSKEEVFLQLLTKQKDYYKEIFDLTALQNDVLLEQCRSKRHYNLRPLLRKKRIMLTCIKEIETAIQPLKKHWHNKDSRQDDISHQIATVLSSLNSLISDIMQLDLQGQKLLAQYIEDLHERHSDCIGHNGNNTRNNTPE